MIYLIPRTIVIYLVPRKLIIYLAPKTLVIYLTHGTLVIYFAPRTLLIYLTHETQQDTNGGKHSESKHNLAMAMTYQGKLSNKEISRTWEIT